MNYRNVLTSKLAISSTYVSYVSWVWMENRLEERFVLVLVLVASLLGRFIDFDFPVSEKILYH